MKQDNRLEVRALIVAVDLIESVTPTTIKYPVPSCHPVLLF